MDKTVDKRETDEVYRQHRMISNGVAGGWTDRSAVEVPHGALIEFSPYILTNPPWKRRLFNRTSATTSLYVNGASYSSARASAKVEMTSNDFIDAPTPYKHKWGTEVETDSLFYMGGLPLSTYDNPKTDSKARMQFVERARKAQQQFEAGVFGGEFGEVVRMIGGAKKEIYNKFGQHLKRIRNSVYRKRYLTRLNLPEATKIVSESWLITKYGIQPLLSDIDSGAKALAELTTYRRPSSTVSGKASSSNRIDSGTHEETRGFIKITSRMETFADFTSRYKGCVTLQEKGYSAFAETFGLNYRNFVPTIYELAPFSFLVDYFTNLNEIVNAFCFNRNSLAWCERGRLEQSSFSVTTRFAPHNLQTGYSWTNVSLPFEITGHYLKFSKHREPYNDTLVPQFEFELPGLTQSLNIGALIGASGGVTNLLKRKVFG